MKDEIENNEQLKIIERVTDKAIKKVERERKNKHRNYIEEWFRYVELVGKKLNKLRIFFDKKTYSLKGWKTIDNYSNDVSFEIKNLKINNQIVDDFFKIPKEEDL